ncbi:MAG: hypothetical protein J6C40_04340 [Lentisphaeria bacterium]|nr:hypothetical protein [Lentisphaeria bacterium]
MFPCEKRLILEPMPGCEWASQMVLNPAMIADPDDPETLHMLFRASGPWSCRRMEGKPLPYPIFIGYGVSCDGGENWEFDFSRPALAPALLYGQEELKTDLPDFCPANGCIEDPRLFYFEDELFLSVACRVFPPGPYWEHDQPDQCMPEWAKQENMPDFIRKNTTVTLLYRVDLTALKEKRYDHAFSYVSPLHEPNRCDNRDVFLFPRRLKINGKEKIICIHRPATPAAYDGFEDIRKPAIFLAAADTFEDFANGKAEQCCIHVPTEPWEANRVGGSWAPLELSPGEWLLPFHGKQDEKVGYTQSFMILEEQESGFPIVTHRCKERLFYADTDWELAGVFPTPCLFTCSGIVRPDGSLLMGYGAADSVIGLLKTDFKSLLEKIRS